MSDLLGMKRKQRMDEALRGAVNTTAEKIRSTAKTKYFLMGVGKDAPPDPVYLTSRTGGLRRSIVVDLAKDKIGNGFQAVVGTNKIYALVHEFGGVRGIKRRPFLTPAREENMLFFLDLVKAALAKGLQE